MDLDLQPLQSNSLASSSTTLPCLTGSALKTSTCTAEQAKQPKPNNDQGAADADNPDDTDHVCAKVQTLESKVARLERTVSLLTKMIERSRSLRQKQNATKADPVDPVTPDTHVM